MHQRQRICDSEIKLIGGGLEVGAPKVWPPVGSCDSSMFVFSLSFLANEGGYPRAFVKHYERIYYDTAALDKIHQEAKVMEDGRLVLLEFQAYQR